MPSLGYVSTGQSSSHCDPTLSQHSPRSKCTGSTPFKALEWLQKSIDGGYEGSISVLGMAYATGIAGIRIDMAKGREMLTFAADKGDEQSARMLGMMDRGEGMFRKQKRENKPRSR